MGGRSPVATFGGKNCSGMLAASLPGACAHLECEYLAGCRVYQLVMPTLPLSHSAGSKFTYEDCWKQNLEQNCSGDSEAGEETEERSMSGSVCHPPPQPWLWERRDTENEKLD